MQEIVGTLKSLRDSLDIHILIFVNEDVFEPRLVFGAQVGVLLERLRREQNQIPEIDPSRIYEIASNSAGPTTSFGSAILTAWPRARRRTRW
jgi:hypothetical protein